MIKYSPQKGIYQGDLTTCDLTDISNVRCILQDDAVWSDGTRVKIDDIIASVNEFRNHVSNSEMKVFWETIRLTKDGDAVLIKSPQKNHAVRNNTLPVFALA